jgi:cobalt-zinc-cadmium efflux system membrane fusion protein
MNAIRRTAIFALTAFLVLEATSLASDEHEHADEHGHADEHDHADEPGHTDEPGEPAGGFSVADFERSGVRVATAGPGEVDVGIDLPGEVRPNGDRIAHLSPRFPGIVREVRKQTGDRVRAGDVLAIIESENLSPFELKAAFDGTVIDKHISPGETVTRDDTVFIVADLSTVWVTISIYQSALPQVAVGQPVALTSGHGTLGATGTIGYITPVVDQATRTASARVVLRNPEGAWRPGLFVTATVYDPRPAAVVIPRRAIQTLERRPVVFVVVGDRFEARPITIGHAGRTRVEIRQGISPGERLADERSFLVKAELAKGEAGHAHDH